MRNMVRGVVFDLDDTLFPARAMQSAAFAEGWRNTPGAHTRLEVAPFRKTLRAAYEARFGYGTPGYAELAHLSLHDLSRCALSDALAQCGVHDAECVERLIQAWIEAERRIFSLYPDTLDTLRALRAASLKLGLITNGPSAVQRHKLTTLALTDLFDVVVIDTEFGCPKPDRRIFEHTAAALDLSPPDLLFVGDNLVADIGGARAAGWLSVWYNPQGAPLPQEAQAPDYTVRALADLLTLLSDRRSSAFIGGSRIRQ